MFCTKCGNAVSDTAKFCPVCGTPVDRGIFADEMREIVASPEVPVQAPVQDNTTPVEETVQPVVKPEPEQTVEPTVQAAEPAPQDYRQDVPDITLTAQKWIPEENGLIAPVPDTAEPPRKKGKKALIITLCAVVVVLGLAVGAAFLISGKYSDKVDALEEYQGSALIDNFSEYGELLDRAQNAEGVLHVFDTFSMGDEID